jgi:L-asparaginase
MKMEKYKVLFLYNGGTIGQETKIDNGTKILVPPKNGDQFKKSVIPIIEEFSKNMDVEFEVVTTKDSSNMTPNDWTKLIFRIKKAQDIEKFDAVAIAHGTDTLPYTATALALALHGRNPKETGLRIPVIITGAQNSIYEAGGDGRFNLENLFRTIDKCLEKGIADVLVNFWNRVVLGCRTIKMSEKEFDAMQSPAFQDVGSIDSKGVSINSSLVRLKKDAKGKLEIAPKFGRGVVSFELTPGIEPSVILGFITEGGVSAMILKSLGDGNVCSEGEFSMIPVIKQSSEEYVTPIFITTKFIGGSASSTTYEAGWKAIKAGAISCLDHTDVAVDIKVRWLIGNGLCSSIDDFRKVMRTSFAGEVTEAVEK